MMDSFVEAQNNLKRMSYAVRHSVLNAAKPRSSLLVHAYGHEVTGLKTYRGPKCKEQFGVCSLASMRQKRPFRQIGLPWLSPFRADLRELRISLNSVIPGCQSAFNFDPPSRVQFCPLEPPLADAVGMSTRNLARHFVSETGITPHEFVERARIDAARMLLEGSDRPLKSVAYDCGFGTADRMRVVFCLGVTPAHYRANFRGCEPRGSG
jgi:AraC-like DNA-binding protein